MSPLATNSLQPIDDRPNRQRRQETPRKPTDIKIHDVIMPRIALPGLKEGPLLATAMAPPVVIPATSFTNNVPTRKRPVLIPRRAAARAGKYFPIGLTTCEPDSWINAWMQFMLFVPLLREIFTYTPQSLSPFNEFIDQYLRDIDENQAVSKAKSREIMLCLMGKFPQFFQRGEVMNLYEIIRTISQSASAGEDGLLRNQQQIIWDSQNELTLNDVFQLPSAPPELLIGLKSLYDPNQSQKIFGQTLQKQYFSTSMSICFDLDAFVEYRIDEGDRASYLAYLKIDGVWVQCDDQRISTLKRSISLDIPLRRGILFHYRRVQIGQNFGFTK